ncbi:WbqC family protein [Winogradskyella sp.]|uniref:WbqC family protein n=1 Tax=Winogradskyella sp. TaxID=1883156 RepID=UPI003F6C84CE
MKGLIHPTYFPNLSHFVVMIKSQTLNLEVCDNYQKQTYRNRTEIYGANGKLALTVPVNYTQKNRQLYKDVRISNENKWQQLHLKSLESAYSMSPFFEFYIDDLLPLFNTKFSFILDLNLACLEVLKDCMQINLSYIKTENFELEPQISDYRYLVNRKSNPITTCTYQQVFSDKHGFIGNLSIIDLLFNEGPSAESYLLNQKF